MTDKFLEIYVWCSLLLQGEFVFGGGRFLFVFFDSPSSPGTHYIDQAGLKLIVPPAFAF